MRAIRKTLKKFDVFGVPFSFRYKNEDRYSTPLGGLFFILFCIIVVVVIIYYFIPFFNRKNYNLVYYSMNLSTTEKIQLKESKAAFSLGLDCNADTDDGTKAEDILQLNINYIIYKKDKNGKRTKYPEKLTSHLCNYADFYNQYNDTFDILNLKTFNCLDKTDHTIEGIFTDESFSYYEFSITTKEDTQENFDRIDKYLTKNDCKLVIYYTDITFDLNNYKDPITPFINEIFIQLNPTLIIKMNAYFMNQYFSNDDYLIFNFDNEKPLTKTLYSREELYSLYKGLKRFETKPNDYKTYSKVYIRADTKKTEIKRKYQKIMEFYADSSSLLIALFEFLFFMFTLINSFYADLSLSKRLFLFREVEANHLDIYKKHKQIKYLIDLTEPYEGHLFPVSPMNNEKPFRANFKSFPLSLKKTETMKSFDKEEIKIYNRKKNVKILENEELSTEKAMNKENESRERRKRTDRIIKKKNPTLSFLKKGANDFQRIQMNSVRNEAYSGVRMNLKSTLIKTKVEDFTIDEPTTKINYTYNIFEVIFSKFCWCCLSKNLRLKRNINKKANIILNKKLDIVLYSRNMILLDIINQTLLDDSKKEILNLLSRPVLYSKGKEEEEYDVLYKNYHEEDFDQFNNEISDLVQKQGKLNIEKKLISLSNKKLKELI